MIPKITDDIRQAIEERAGQPVYLVDAATDATYVLLRADEYERIKPLFETEPYDSRDLYPFVEQSFLKAGWDDPAMDAYNDYEANRPKP